MNLIALLFLAVFMPAPIRIAPSRASPEQRVAVPVNPFDAKRLVRACDRLVIARVGRLREFGRRSGSLGSSTPPKIRIAELEVVSAPFGSMGEVLHVRIPEGATLPEIAAWPLQMNLLRSDDDWRAFARIEKELRADPLWMPLSEDDPWAVGAGALGMRVLVPGWMLENRAGTGFEPTGRFESRWIELDQVESALAEELARISPQTEARISSTGASNWHVQIDGDGRGSSGTDTFVWSETQRAPWELAIEKFGFAEMPNEVGSSPAPCSAVLVLSRVTAGGRRTVRYFGNGRRDGATDPWGVRFEGLWSELRTLVPMQSR